MFFQFAPGIIETQAATTGGNQKAGGSGTQQITEATQKTSAADASAAAIDGDFSKVLNTASASSTGSGLLTDMVYRQDETGTEKTQTVETAVVTETAAAESADIAVEETQTGSSRTDEKEAAAESTQTEADKEEDASSEETENASEKTESADAAVGETKTEKTAQKETDTEDETGETGSTWDGPVLNSYVGAVYGPSGGKEVYYNMDMSQVVRNLQAAGYEGSYWVRDDGVKMFGSYVMVAACYSVHPYGSLVETTLGTAIVCDTGTFAYSYPYMLDVAVTW